LSKETHSSLRELAVLQDATEMILSSSDADTVLHQILLIVRNYFGVSNCTVLLVDKDAKELFIRAMNGYDEETVGKRRYKVGVQGVTGYVAQNGIPLYVPDVSKEPRYIAASASVKSEFAVPLIARDEVIGVLDLESDKVDFFSDEMIGLIALFASQAAVALENARLYSTERRRMRQIEFINLIARSATAASELDQLLMTLCDLVGDTFDGCQVSVLLRAPNGVLTLEAHSGGEMPEPLSFEAAQRNGILAEALRARMNVVANDVRDRAGYQPCIPGSGAELAVPLLSLGETVGALVISSPRQNDFVSDDRSIAQAAADVCATAIRNVQLTEELRRIANTDSLTGMYNQRYFHVAVGQEISRAKRFGKTFSALMFDIRGFRNINNALGFDGADDVLRAIAHALPSCMRSIDTVCRYSGDRFAILLPETENGQIQAVKEKISHAIETLSAPGSSGELRLTAFFAHVAYPVDGATELELVRHLLARLDREKQSATTSSV